MADLKITNLHKHYGGVQAVRGIDLEVASGEFTVLVGPSGCGKSTLLRTIAGLETPDGGTLEIAGKVVNYVRPRDRDIAMVFQNYALYPYMNVFENIAFGLRARKTPQAEVETRVRRAADMLGITALLERLPRQLSGGQRQRVAIGRAIVRNARLFLFDEPLEQPRCPAARRDAQRDQAPASGAGHHHDLRDPRPDRGDDPRRPDRAAARRARSSRRARRSISMNGRRPASSQASSARRR